MASDDPVERVPAAQAVGEDLASGGQPALGAARDLALAEALDRDQLDLARPALGAGGDRRHEGRLARRATAPLAAGARAAEVSIVHLQKSGSMMSARSACSPSPARPARARGGTSSSPATTISATRPWWAPRCATPATTATAGPSPCSASAPRHGNLAPRDRFIGWTPELREKNLPLVTSTTRGSSSYPGSPSPDLGWHILSLVCRFRARRLKTERYRGPRPCSWRRSILEDAPLGLVRFTRHPAGFVSESPKFDGVTTVTSCTTSPSLTSRSRPLRKDWRRILNRRYEPPPSSHHGTFTAGAITA